MDPLSQIHGLPVQQSASEWDLATCIFRRPRTDIHEPERSDAGDSCRSCHEYRFIKYIGHGVHSSVYEADNRRTGEKVSVLSSPHVFKFYISRHMAGPKAYIYVVWETEK